MNRFLLLLFASLDLVVRGAGLRYARYGLGSERRPFKSARAYHSTVNSKQRVRTPSIWMTDVSHGSDVGERVAVITGGTSEFGAAIASGLAQTGKYDRLVIVGRSKQRAYEIVNKLRDDVKTEFIEADLSSMDEVRSVCRELKGIRLQCLVCAAGRVALVKRMETNDGHEYHFGLNFLSRFLMVNKLIEELSSGGTESDPARVLLIGSDRHWGAPVLGFSALGPSSRLAMGDFGDMQFKDSASYGAWEAFGQAALCNVMFAYEMQKRLRNKGANNIAVSCVDPGPMLTKWHLYAREENRERADSLSFLLPRSIAPYFTRVVEHPEIVAEAFVTLATTPLGSLPSRFSQTNNFVRESPTPSKFPVPWSWGTSYDEESWSTLWSYAESLLNESVPERVRGDWQASNLGSFNTEGRKEMPAVRLVYAWLWFWWHAPNFLVAKFARKLLKASTQRIESTNAT